MKWPHATPVQRASPDAGEWLLVSWKAILPTVLLPLVTRGPGRPPLDDTPEAALQAESRQAILAVVKRVPGIPVTELMREVGLGEGVFYHHFRKLEASGLLETRDTISHKRVFLAGTAPPEEESILLSATTRWVASCILKRPGSSSAEIAEEMGFAQRVVRRHLQRLSGEGFITSERNGLRLTYSPTEKLRRVDLRK